MPLQRDFSVSTVSVPGWLVIARLGGPSCAACWPPPGGTRDAEPATLLGGHSASALDARTAGQSQVQGGEHLRAKGGNHNTAAKMQLES